MITTIDYDLCSHFGALNGDAPFIGVDTIKGAYNTQNRGGEAAENRGCTVISAEVEDPTGYGRIVRESGEGMSALKAIVEEKEADDETRRIREVNSGAYWFSTDELLGALDKLKKSEKTGEYYLTDTIEIIKNSGKAVMAHKAENSDSVLGAKKNQAVARFLTRAFVPLEQEDKDPVINAVYTDTEKKQIIRIKL